jgi:hypothetical protein
MHPSHLIVVVSPSKKRSKKKKKMSTELKVLQQVGLLRKRSNSIPFGVVFWGSFLTCIFKKKAIPQNLNQAVFSQRARRWLKRCGPREVRKSDAYIRQVVKIWWGYYEALCLSPIIEVKNTIDRGVGVFFKKQGSTLEEVRRALKGFIAWVDEDEFKMLKEAKYPSLYSTASGCFILFGPLSLVNHACGSSLRFSMPLKRVNEDSFPEITIKQLSVSKRFGREEVLVDYFNGEQPDFECCCGNC